MVKATLSKVFKFILVVPQFKLWSNHCYLIVSACTERVGNSLFMPLILKMGIIRIAFSEECFVNVLMNRN